MLVSQIGFLYNSIGNADQLPGKEVEVRFKNLKNKLERLKNVWE